MSGTDLKFDFVFSPEAEAYLKRLSDTVVVQEFVLRSFDGMMNLAVNLVRGKAFDLAPYATHNLQNSILPTTWVAEGGFAVYGQVTAHAPYAMAVEFGSRPHWPPPDALALWAQRKFGVTKKESFRIAFLVGRKIAARGTAPHPFMAPALEETKADIERLFDATCDEINNQLAIL